MNGVDETLGWILLCSSEPPDVGCACHWIQNEKRYYRGFSLDDSSHCRSLTQDLMKHHASSWMQAAKK